MLTTEVKASKEVDKLPEKNVLVKDAGNRKDFQNSQHGSVGSTARASNPALLLDYPQILEALGDAVIICGSDGLIRLWNAAAERLFGFTTADALGSSLDLIIPERLRERHWARFTRTMTTGQTRYENDVLRVPATHKDGRTLSIAFTVGLVLGAQRTVMGLVAVIRDETKAFAKLQDLRKRLAELEKETQRVSATNNTGS